MVTKRQDTHTQAQIDTHTHTLWCNRPGVSRTLLSGDGVFVSVGYILVSLELCRHYCLKR